MPATFKLVLAPRADGDGLHDVRLRVTANRVSRFLNTGVALPEKHWNPKALPDRANWVRTGHHDHGHLNAALATWLRRGHALALDNPSWAAAQFQATLRNHDFDPSAPDFIGFCRKLLAQHTGQLNAAHAQGRAGAGWGQATVEGRAAVINKLAAWHGGPLHLAQLTPELVKKYETYLTVAVGNNATTTVKNLKVLHLFIRHAVRARLLKPHQDPMHLYEHLPVAPQRVWLSADELALLETAPLPPRLHLARQVYFLQHYCHGSRIGAMLRLQWKDRAAGRLRFEVDKGGDAKTIEELPPLTALLDGLRPVGGPPAPTDYVLPFLPAGFAALHPAQKLDHIKRATSQINANLKRVAERLGIDKKLSSHVARRTLASLGTGTLSLREIGGLLGHKQARTTELYVEGMDTSQVDAAARRVYGGAGTT